MFTVLTASARTGATFYGQYRRVAVVELTAPDAQPRMISTRARGVKRIVRTWERLSVGKTARCAYRRALADAGNLAAALTSYHAADVEPSEWEAAREVLIDAGVIG